ncbi:hypothetical protein GCM10027425_12330 [Alteromonas gracilis]
MKTSTTLTADHEFDEADNRGALTAVSNATGRFRADVRSGRYPVVPDAVTAAIGAGDTLRDLHRDLFDGTAEGDQACGLLDRLISGHDPREALDQAVDAVLSTERRDRAAKILDQAKPGLDRFLRDTITENLPEMLAGLRTQLDETVAVLRTAYTDVGDLDVHEPDPMLVAKASAKQRAALVTIAESTRVYTRIRNAQRDLLAASSAPVPGDNPWRAYWSWKDVFKAGVHEVASPNLMGLPGDGQPRRRAVRAVVQREDVWLPDLEQISEAWDRLEAMRVQSDVPQPEPEPEPLGQINPAFAAVAEASVQRDKQQHLQPALRSPNA